MRDVRRSREPIKLNLGGTQGASPEYQSTPKDFDPLVFPWKITSGSISELWCHYLLARVPAKVRPRFFEEVYRIMAKDGKATFVVPYCNSARAIMDVRYEWPPFSELSFLCLNKQWREQNKVDLPIACDFDFTYGYLPDPELQTRTPDVQQHWIKHYMNAVSDLQVTLIRREP
jgi:hypothetical protein